MKPKMLFSIFAAMLCVTLLVSPSKAAPFQITGLNPLISETGQYTNGVNTTGNVYIGQYLLTTTSPLLASLEAFCYGPFTLFYVNGWYNNITLASVVGAPIANAVANALYNAPTPNTPDRSAALAAAIQELVNGGLGTDGGVLGGTFRVLGLAAAVTTAADLIVQNSTNGVWTHPGSFVAMALTSDVKNELPDQPFTYGKNIPEPASLAILGIGLLGLGLVSRKGKSL